MENLSNIYVHSLPLKRVEELQAIDIWSKIARIAQTTYSIQKNPLPPWVKYENLVKYEDPITDKTGDNWFIEVTYPIICATNLMEKTGKVNFNLWSTLNDYFGRDNIEAFYIKDSAYFRIKTDKDAEFLYNPPSLKDYMNSLKKGK